MPALASMLLGGNDPKARDSWPRKSLDCASFSLSGVIELHFEIVPEAEMKKVYYPFRNSCS
ncbi:MAG TPA: hypothetical protein VGQ65_03195 [Thermoanaerobaculia bacterium]|nr:hypothetical protein [Thermoanaerobaculia bacterium]